MLSLLSHSLSLRACPAGQTSVARHLKLVPCAAGEKRFLSACLCASHPSTFLPSRFHLLPPGSVRSKRSLTSLASHSLLARFRGLMKMCIYLVFARFICSRVLSPRNTAVDTVAMKRRLRALLSRPRDAECLAYKWNITSISQHPTLAYEDHE